MERSGKSERGERLKDRWVIGNNATSVCGDGFVGDRGSKASRIRSQCVILPVNKEGEYSMVSRMRCALGRTTCDSV